MAQSFKKISDLTLQELEDMVKVYNLNFQIFEKNHFYY